MEIRVKLDELKKALGKMEAETSDMTVRVTIDGQKLLLKSFDRQESEIEISVFNSEVNMAPKVKRTTTL